MFFVIDILSCFHREILFFVTLKIIFNFFLIVAIILHWFVYTFKYLFPFTSTSELPSFIEPAKGQRGRYKKSVTRGHLLIGRPTCYIIKNLDQNTFWMVDGQREKPQNIWWPDMASSFDRLRGQRLMSLRSEMSQE